MKPDSAQRELVKILQGEIMPLARAGGLMPVIAALPINPPKPVKLTPRETPPLPLLKDHRFSGSNTRWPARGLHSSRYPIIGCISQGEADFCIGVTEPMLEKAEGANPEHGEYVLALPRGSVFIIPPETPYSDGNRLHWERPHPENAFSRIVWVQILPLGAVVHSCQTQGTAHTHTSAVLVRDTRLAVFAQFLFDNSGNLPNSGEIIAGCLLTLLLCLDQSLASRPALGTGDVSLAFLAASEGSQPHAAMPDEAESAIVERICSYIRLHLSNPLTLAQIAQSNYISVARLKRLFRSELDIPVMKYVTRCRIDEARVLLEGTTLSTLDIGKICGYPHRTHFSRAFSAAAGLSPEAYRRQLRK